MHETLQRLSSVMESVKETLGSVKDTLLDHGKKFDILIKDAIKGMLLLIVSELIDDGRQMISRMRKRLLTMNQPVRLCSRWR